jgi:hypothetical protein
MKDEAWVVNIEDGAVISGDAQEKFAEDLISLIERTFIRAYTSRINGMTEDEMLIFHDIEAAARNVDKTIVQTCRATIRCAVRAVDSKVQFDQAHQYLVDQLRSKVDKIIKRNNRKQQRRQRNAMGQN